MQQPPKRTKEKERKKKRSKNSPQSPTQHIIPEGQITDFTAIPGTSAADVPTNNDSTTELVVQMVLDTPKGDILSHDTITGPVSPNVNEETERLSPVRCATPMMAPNIVPQSSITELAVKPVLSMNSR